MLRELYQEMILDHGKTPRNFGKLPQANHQQVGHNPLCGDRLMVTLIEHNGIVEDIRFEGSGCAISMASASLMTECIKGKTVQEVEALFEKFHTLVTTGQESQEDIGKLTIFRGVAEFPMRVKCATLAWHTLNAALQNKTDPVSTE
jgi:nitrogen fixation protein NifU and related proteins